MVSQRTLRVLSRASLSSFAAVAIFAPSAWAQNAAVTVQIDVADKRHPISPFIYGVSYGSTGSAGINSPFNRIGGNNTTRYNWHLNADNKGSDYYFQSIGDADATPGQRVDSFIDTNITQNTASMITIPIIGWVAKLPSNRAMKGSFSIKKYGAQTGANGDAGNGVRTNGRYVVNDRNDANTSVNVAFMQPWVEHLVRKYGNAASGGVKYYILDNEPSIWHATHRDVQPVGVKMGDLFAKLRDYGAMVKNVDPTALVLGPEEWGWTGYFHSGYDIQRGFASPTDKAAHGGLDHVAYLLSQFRAEEARTGRRTLDVFSLHYYPQGGEYGTDVTTAMQLRRNRSTRSLWDPNYRDETWIADTVRLIPRMHDWVEDYYPGTKTAITEYSWGAEDHINGATTQADILGIFGREGLDMAARWSKPYNSTVTYKAMQMYRNYDGANSTFGDTSVACAVPNPDNLAAFASQDSATDTVKVMIVSKVLSGKTPVTLNLANFTPGTEANVYQLTSTNVINRLSNLSLTGNSVTLTVPAQSITLLVINKEGTAARPTPPSPPSTLTAQALSAASIKLSWVDNSTDETGFKIERSTDNVSFSQVATVEANATTFESTPLGGNTTYYYRVRAYNTEGGDSSYSNVASAKTSAVATPLEPSALTAQTLSAASIKLTWTDNSANETGFKIERSANNVTFSPLITVGANITTFENKLLNSSTTYYYRVCAYNTEGGDSSYSNVASAKTSAAATATPPAPSALTAQALSAASIKLTWTDNSANESGFIIQRSTDNVTFSQLITVGANVTTFENKGLSSSKTYYYRVRAHNPVGKSVYSNKASAKTLAK